jgi:electron transport complex protein RnfB
MPKIIAIVDPKKCIACGTCEGACPSDAIHVQPEGFAVVDASKCNGRLECIKVCPTGAVHSITIPG